MNKQQIFIGLTLLVAVACSAQMVDAELSEAELQECVSTYSKCADKLKVPKEIEQINQIVLRHDPSGLESMSDILRKTDIDLSEVVKGEAQLENLKKVVAEFAASLSFILPSDRCLEDGKFWPRLAAIESNSNHPEHANIIKLRNYMAICAEISSIVD